VGLGREDRARNVAAAFAVKRRWRQAIEGKRTVVVDDVATTGATLAAAREALLRVGAAEVVLAAVAVAEPRSVALGGEFGHDVPAQ
jgi:predicted amidophosphoribosyltransferase